MTPIMVLVPSRMTAPIRNLRLVAWIEQPTYFVVAVKDSTGITDLAQIKAKKMPIKIYSSGAGAKVLAYYGLTKEALEPWGGSLGPVPTAEDPNAVPVPNPGNRPRNVPDFDVYLYNAVMANNPESNLMYQITPVQKLNFLQLPEDLLNQLAVWPSQRVVMPQAYFAGVEHNIKTVGGGGSVVFVRDDTPDNFAYDLAKALDKQKSLLKWYVMPFSYNPETVASVKDVPLAPGAARYYRAVGYIK
jgi:TRAP-type uncharacterized transport system substrate-binding protein